MGVVGFKVVVDKEVTLTVIVVEVEEVVNTL